MYWSDWGSPSTIEQASLDGKNRKTIISSELRWPNALTLDLDQQILYWADANFDKIESSFVNGSNRRLIVARNQGIHHPFSITIHERTLYWTDWFLDGVLSIELKDTLSNATILVKDLIEEPMGIQVITGEKQPPG